MYPTVHKFKAHLDLSEPKELFEDLHWSDFIFAAGCVAQCKIRHFDMDPYPNGLLQRGLDKFGDEECRGLEFLVGLEYLAAVRMTVMDVVADINDQLLKNNWSLEELVEGLGERVNNVVADMDICYERFDTFREDLTDVFQRLRASEEQCLMDTKRNVVMLIHDQEELVDQVNVEANTALARQSSVQRNN